MPWYYYSGNVVKAIPIRKGVSLAVQPRTKVEITNDGVREVQVLVRKGVLRKTGKPVGSQTFMSEPSGAEAVRSVTPKSEMARFIAEKGTTTSKTQAPKMKTGSPEMTELEEKAKKLVDEETRTSSSEDKSKEDAPVDMLKEDEKAHSEESKGEKWSKKKSRKK